LRHSKDGPELPRANAALQRLADEKDTGQREDERDKYRVVVPLRQFVFQIEERGRGNKHEENPH
jgi:hypothetical protein